MVIITLYYLCYEHWHNVIILDFQEEKKKPMRKKSFGMTNLPSDQIKLFCTYGR